MYHNALSLMAIIATLKLFSCKRWTKSVEAHTKPPAILVTQLSKTMKTTRELGLLMPANLQAVASKYANTDAS